MRAIGRKLQGTVILLAAMSTLTGPLGGQDTPEAAPATISVLAHLAAALSQNNASAALQAFDSGMKSFGEVEANVNALTAQNEILCAIDVVQEEETDGTALLDVDWFLQLKSQGDASLSERRRERVRLQMKKFRGKWKIISIDPIGILNPIQIQSK